MDKIPRESLDAVCRAAFNHFGTSLQLDKIQEECGELIAAVNHFRTRGAEGRKELIEELADVKIVLRQVETAIGAAEVDVIVQEKLRRLRDMIRNERTESGQTTEIIGQRQI